MTKRQQLSEILEKIQHLHSDTSLSNEEVVDALEEIEGECESLLVLTKDDIKRKSLKGLSC